MRLLALLAVCLCLPALAQQPAPRPVLRGLRFDAGVTLTPPDQLFPRYSVQLLYELPVNKSAAYREYLTRVSDQRLLQEVVETANGLATFKDRNVLVWFRECGKPNAFYQRANGSISFCFELVKLFDELYAKLAPDPQAAVEAVRGATFFVFLHEFGHALIHELDLPITGREEDAVDQFATLVLLEGGEAGERAALSGALFFLALSEQPGKRPVFWDEHSLDAQRFYNIACWLYGASPFSQVNLVAKGLLPPERAARCGDEFQQLRRAWKAVADAKLRRPLR